MLDRSALHASARQTFVTSDRQRMARGLPDAPSSTLHEDGKRDGHWYAFRPVRERSFIHHPAETMTTEDVDIAARVFADFLSTFQDP